MTTHHFYKFDVPLGTDAVLVLVLLGLTVAIIAGVFLYDEFKPGQPKAEKRRSNTSTVANMVPLL